MRFTNIMEDRNRPMDLTGIIRISRMGQSSAFTAAGWFCLGKRRDSRSSFGTPPLRFEGDRLMVNLNASAMGEVLVELQDEKGMPQKGYAFEDCDPMHGNDLAKVDDLEPKSRSICYSGPPPSASPSNSELQNCLPSVWKVGSVWLHRYTQVFRGEPNTQLLARMPMDAQGYSQRLARPGNRIL